MVILWKLYEIDLGIICIKSKHKTCKFSSLLSFKINFIKNLMVRSFTMCKTIRLFLIGASLWQNRKYIKVLTQTLKPQTDFGSFQLVPNTLNKSKHTSYDQNWLQSPYYIPIEKFKCPNLQNSPWQQLKFHFCW